MTGFEWPLEMLLNTNLLKEGYLFWKKWGEMTELAKKLVHKIYQATPQFLSHKILHVVVGLSLYKIQTVKLPQSGGESQ